MRPDAEYITGSGFGATAGLGESFDCGMLVGSHAMNGTPDGVLCHTQSSLWDSRYWYNGVECGEIVQDALIMGHFGIPVVMVTGDEAACREARCFLGDQIVTVAVKKGYSRESCKMVSPTRAHEMIRCGAREAIEKIGVCRPYRMDLPIQARLEKLTAMLPSTASPQMVATAPRQTLEKVCESALDILRFDP